MLDTLNTITANPSLLASRSTSNVRRATRKGTTLIEVMLAVAIIVIASLGTLCYEYLCVHHIRFARAQLAATRIGQLLLEDWKSTGGSSDYNPEDLSMGFGASPGDMWGDYITVIDGLPYFIALSQNNVDTDVFAGVTLRRIDVSVRWRRDLSYGSPNNDDPAVNLTTYVRQDQ